MDLATIIGTIESDMDRRAMRFEPVVYGRNIHPDANEIAVKIHQINRCSLATASVIYSTSWGIFQFMGFTIYGLGYDKHIIDFIDSPEDQGKLFDQYLSKNSIAFSIDELKNDLGKRQLFALHYNGPGNVDDYADRILKAIQILGV